MCRQAFDELNLHRSYTCVMAINPVEAVFAVDRSTPHPPSVFIAQQAVVFPALDASSIQQGGLYRDHYRFFDERMQRDRVPPFFNSVETPAERAAFLKVLGVTHVVVSPAHYDELRPVLDSFPHQFALKYDKAQWTVYEATWNSN